MAGQFASAALLLQPVDAPTRTAIQCCGFYFGKLRPYEKELVRTDNNIHNWRTDNDIYDRRSDRTQQRRAATRPGYCTSTAAAPHASAEPRPQPDPAGKAQCLDPDHPPFDGCGRRFL